MQHGEATEVEPRERATIVEIALQRNDAVASEPAHIVAMTREADEAHAVPQQVGDPQGDIAATHEQQPLHHDPAD